MQGFFISSAGLPFYLVSVLNRRTFLSNYNPTAMEYFTELGYTGLFIAAFLSATILPLGSVVVLAPLLLSGLSPSMLVVVATIGNVLGSMTNYALGYWASLSLIKKWLRMSEEEFVRAEQHFKKYGIIALLFTWLPFIGDPLTVLAGILRIRLHWFVVLVTVGKAVRYIIASYLILKVG